VCVGLALQEVLTFNLTSREKQEKMAGLKGQQFVEIANPVSGNWSIMRRNIYPELLEFLSKNKHVEYPQNIFEVGKTVELECLDTPGHTMSHICLLSHTDQPALFSGDTLFNAGAGNCHNGGHPSELFNTFATQLGRLPDSTLIYPGHDYIANNLRFTLDREPDNARAKTLLKDIEKQDPAAALVSTLALEREINTFFRLTSPSVIKKLREAFPDLPERPDPRTVFLKLRELRNAW